MSELIETTSSSRIKMAKIRNNNRLSVQQKYTSVLLNKPQGQVKLSLLKQNSDKGIATLYNDLRG